MRKTIALGASLAVALLAGSALAAGDLKSGPPEGSRRLPPFNPLHCNGKQVGSRVCLV
jgi:hypothetical protein